MSPAYSWYFSDPRGPKYCRLIISENPMMAFSGVRNSWLMEARKLDFALLACSASIFAEYRFSSTRLYWRAMSPISELGSTGMGREKSPVRRCTSMDRRMSSCSVDWLCSLTFRPMRSASGDTRSGTNLLMSDNRT